MAKKGLGIALDTKGFDKMLEAIDKKHRIPALKEALYVGVGMVQNKIRTNYKTAKPSSNLDQAIVPYMYPSGEGAGVRRWYVKGGMGARYGRTSPIYRAYILNFLEKGAINRVTKGKGRKQRGANYAGRNRGSIPALRFFRRGWSSTKNKALKEMERLLLIKIAKLSKGKK